MITIFVVYTNLSKNFYQNRSLIQRNSDELFLADTAKLLKMQTLYNILLCIFVIVHYVGRYLN